MLAYFHNYLFKVEALNHMKINQKSKINDKQPNKRRVEYKFIFS